ncbi:hypothetical protein IQ260_25665 [Leptolyngbya cf. ectocarpi LEGE 11479]|uniref:Uncharacterized protein n=1 Tax=Leptolyngbya cf. ectocarpi LEGE 11479 TaxID=1828722 RepID=A0A928ZZ13_LEPEC|nr:hypothetical protein [Leptolyngbya ectocarpi]MBE9070033.1 hypothetical protein [Leptolyngbya cf. ectocarpi LEGE 11479]
MTEFEAFIQKNPEIDLWKYIQKNPDKAQIFFELESVKLFKLMERIILFEDIIISNNISLEKQILMVVLHLKKDLPPRSLVVLFKVRKSQVFDIIEYWIDIIFERDEEIKNLLFKDSKKSEEAQLNAKRFLTSQRRLEEEYSLLCAKESENCVIQHFQHCISVAGAVGNVTGAVGAALGSFSNIELHRKPNINSGYLKNENEISNDLEPLPHNGLFIRRNNQFGTRLTVGIKDLLERGELIDQTQVRFDDFVAPNSEAIPSPSDDSSVAVSYGIASIPLSQKRDDRASHYLEIALKAADTAPENQPKNQPPLLTMCL